jgi:peptidoglycan/xylan/chitin deacetylase (PgdA/CDA1 family)
MMHSKDRYILQQTIIPFLVQNHYTTLTYSDYFDILNGKKPLPDRPVILSIDDIPADYINPYFRAMFESLHGAGLTATIAMNPNQPPEKTAENVQASWALVKQWSGWGMAVETHTVNHRYLPGASQPEVAFEIQESARRISAGIGRDPIALVLPYGAEDTTGNVQVPGLIGFSRSVNLKFLVGITGGRQLEVTSLPISDESYPLYVGRVGADHTQPGETLWEIAHWYCAVPACAHLAPVDCSNPNATLTP